MKNLKKISALILALILVLSLSAAALADGAALTAHDGTTSDNEVVRILKEITVYNPSNCSIHEPNQIYDYSIAAGSSGKYITDANSIKALTKAGVITGVTMTSSTNSTPAATTTITYDPETDRMMTASPAGTANNKWIDIDFSAVVFGAAGVYRYVITEALNASGGSYDDNGVIEGTTNHTRYLDVYVKQSNTFNNGSTADEWDVYGYALFTADSNIIDDADSTNGNETTLYKTTGFVADSTNDKTADAVYTFNVTIQKTLVNDFAMNSNEFPFLVTFDSEVDWDYRPIASSSGTATVTSWNAAGDLNSTTYNGTNSATDGWQILIANGGSVTFTGLPAGTTVTIDEYNNVTGTYYSVATSGGTTNNTTEVALPWSTWASDVSGWTNVTAVQTLKADGDDMENDSNFTVTFTNTLAQISPTGVVLRVAPFALILAGGFFLLLISRRRREEAEAA